MKVRTQFEQLVDHLRVGDKCDFEDPYVVAGQPEHATKL